MTFSPLLQGISLDTEPCLVFDLSIGCPISIPDLETPRLTPILFKKMSDAGVRVGIGRYNETRALYTAPEFASGPRPTDERRTVHLGLDLFAEPGTVVCAPVAGTVHAFANNARRLDYGPMIILNNGDYFTLYGHLTLDSLDGLYAGQSIAAGQPIGKIGLPPENGDWTPHLHFRDLSKILLRLGLRFSRR